MRNRSLLGLCAWVLTAASVAVSSGCSGGAAGTTGVITTDPGGAGGASLASVEVGRLVDLFAYRVVDQTGTLDRRATRNRQPVLIARNVVVNPAISSNALFDVTGAARSDANFRFLPFDVSVGHDQLLILWDDRIESTQFESARTAAETGLVSVAPAFRGQNVLTQPVPVAPRNGAFKLTFTRGLGVDSNFFRNNPGAIQLLRFRDDPDVVGPLRAFVPQDVRVIAQDNVIILDTTVLGAESVGGLNPSNGLESSSDNVTANYRIAIPVNGIVSDLLDVEADSINAQNRIDFRGDSAVVRDFRAGNASDGSLSALDDVEQPNVIAVRDMGIVDVDTDERILTINKRDRLLALRGRIPFVDGPIDPDTMLPAGTQQVPTADVNGLPFALPSGDFITQTVVSSAGELVTLRAEVVENLDVNNVLGDGEAGLTSTLTDGGELPMARVRVTSIEAFDSAGNRVSFQSSTGEGAACTVQVRYYEAVPYRSGTTILSDADRRSEFLTISPEPVDAAGMPLSSAERLARLTDVDPNAEIGAVFSEPIDLERLAPTDNFVLTNEAIDAAEFQLALASPKSANLSILNTELIDQDLDGSDLRLRPPLGLDHQDSATETYWFHIDLAANAVADFAGNPLQLFDFRSPDPGNPAAGIQSVPIRNFSVPFDLSRNSAEQRIGSQIHRFAALDEDGTPNGAFDFFGQFQLSGGRLRAASVTRQVRSADEANLGAITRFQRGECYVPGNSTDPMNVIMPFHRPLILGPPPPPPFGNTGATYGAGPANTGGPAGVTGFLYQTPSSFFTVQQPPQVFTPPQMPQDFGGIAEPHTPFGARMQITYREDDFGLSYTSASDLNLDVEQLFWATWNEQPILFDVFDRYTMRLGHSRKRPDLKFQHLTVDTDGDMMDDTVFCELNCLSLASGLSTTFANNVLPGSDLTTVVNNAEYVINPTQARRSDSGFVYHTFPTFERTYTWRDSRLVTVDESGAVVGLGGAIDPASGPAPAGMGGDVTANVDSPWIQSSPLLDVNPMPSPTFFYPTVGTSFPTGVYVEDAGDFRGEIANDHDPIALPLLVDFSVFPDNTIASSNGGNLFHTAFMGPGFADNTPALNGYYNQGNPIGGRVNTVQPFQCNNLDWPSMRVYSFGGPNLTSPGSFDRVIPDQTPVAQGGVVLDRGVGAVRDPINGLGRVGPADSHLYWGQIVLARRVSLMTFGFFDTQTPNQHGLDPMTVNAPLPPATGLPDLTGAGGVTDFIVTLDPPVSRQPGGTLVTLEIRGADSIPNATVYDPSTEDEFDLRGNLYNPNFACEAYRYSAGVTTTDPIPPALPGAGNPLGTPNMPQTRPAAEGLTPYVIEGEIDSIRNVATGFLPRYLNLRLVMENNIDVEAAAVPSLRALGISYRMQ